MNISASITLAPGDPEITPAVAAADILEALGGDESKDLCTVSIMAVGQVGGPPPPPPPVADPEAPDAA